MTRDTLFGEIEQRILQLSCDEQLWLSERLRHRLQQRGPTGTSISGEQLAVMAADPDIQRELRQIAEDFAATELGGRKGTVYLGACLRAIDG